MMGPEGILGLEETSRRLTTLQWTEDHIIFLSRL